MGSRKSASIKATEAVVTEVTGGGVKNPLLRYSTSRCRLSPRRNKKHTNQCSRLRDNRCKEIFKTTAHSVGVWCERVLAGKDALRGLKKLRFFAFFTFQKKRTKTRVFDIAF